MIDKKEMNMKEKKDLNLILYVFLEKFNYQ